MSIGSRVMAISFLFNFFLSISAYCTIITIDDQILVQKADSLVELEKLEEAVDLYKQLLVEETVMEAGDGEVENIRYKGDYIILYKIGSTLVMAGREVESQRYLYDAHKIASNQGDSIMVAKIYMAMGRAHEYIGNPDSALFCYRSALSIWEEGLDSTYIAGGYQSVAQLLRVVNRRPEAKVYIRKALELIPGVKDRKILANIYNETAFLYEIDRQFDTAKLYYRKLIEVSRKYNNMKGVSAGYSNLASVFTHENNYQEALKYYNMGLEIDLELDYSYYIACSYRGIATCYYGMGDFLKALHYIELSDHYQDKNWLSENFINEEWRYKIYKASGDYFNALSAYEKFKVMEDSMLNIENQKNISEILTRYETEKKESQIQMLAQTNRINDQKIKIQTLLLVIFGFLLLTVALITYSIIQLKNTRISQMERELQNYASQIPITTQSTVATNGDQAIEAMMALGLTKREAEILDLIRNGLSNEEISEKLFVSKNTIKFHIKNIYIKLDVKNRAQALKLAFIQ